VTEDFIDTAQIEKLFGQAGLDPAREIVVYADRGSAYAHFGRYALRYFGAANVSVFHDGIEGWQAAGGAVETDNALAKPVTVKLTEQSQLAIGTDDVVARAKAGSVQILDVRTSGEYAGNDVRAIRGGNIPGAVNIPYEMNWKDPETTTKLARRLVPDNNGATLTSPEKTSRRFTPGSIRARKPSCIARAACALQKRRRCWKRWVSGTSRSTTRHGSAMPRGSTPRPPTSASSTSAPSTAAWRPCSGASTNWRS
jgi:rhodanese-related sulfurtransferase